MPHDMCKTAKLTLYSLQYLLSIGYLTGDDLILATVKQSSLKDKMRFNVYTSPEHNTFMFAKVSELLQPSPLVHAPACMALAFASKRQRRGESA